MTLHDLNIVWTPQTTQSELERTLRFSKSLGYNVVALAQTIKAPIQAQPANPIPQLGPAHPSFPRPPPPPQNQSPSSCSSSSSSNLPTTLRRATILIDDPATNHRLPTLAATYDLLAARPTTEKAFSAACVDMAHIALISLDLTVSQSYRFKPKPCMAAVHRGVLFEVCYGQLLLTDARARANFIANVQELVRATKGRGIVLSSEVRAAAAGGGGLRAPADVVNLMACWGLGTERGLEALGVNPRAVVVNEGLRRRSFRGVVDVVQAEGRIPAHAGKQGEGDDDDNGREEQQKRGGKQQKQKHKGGPKQAGGQGNPQPGGNGKRKHDEAGDREGGETTLPVMSKRQAKKLKLAEKKAGTGESANTTT
ncbi:unnamed protein product [Discula destructiva]